MNFWRFACAVLVAATVVSSSAGTPCSDHGPDAESLRRGLNLALQTRQSLESSGAQVALVARVGQDLSKYGLRYSHVGFVWRNHPEAPWLVVHLLNECGTAESNLYDQGLGNFFTDDLFAWEARIVIPSPEVQVRLAAALADKKIERLHERQYNMLAYPYATRYQNSNQWVLEMLNEGFRPNPALDRRQAQDWYRNAGYMPTRLTLGPLTRLGGRMFRANVAFDDHPDQLRWNDMIDTVTVESVIKFIGKIDPLAKSITITLN